MTTDEDRKIRSVFEQLRQEEERSIPEFHQVLQAKDSPHRAAGWKPLWRPAVALLILILAAGPILYFSLRQTGVRDGEMSFELERWESPTDFLLSFSDTSLDPSLLEIDTTFWEEDDFPNLEN